MSRTAIQIDPISEAVGDVEYVMEELGGALEKRLFDTLASLNDALARERAAKEQEARTLRASHAELQRRVEAQARILDGEIDRAIAEGRDVDAEAKRQERAELERSLRNILAQAETCEQHSGEIAEEMAANYRAVFERAYPEIRQSTVTVAIALSKMLDKVWNGILRFESESGLPLVRTSHRANLTPDEHGPEASYFTALQKWFGGRR